MHTLRTTQLQGSSMHWFKISCLHKSNTRLTRFNIPEWNDWPSCFPFLYRSTNHSLSPRHAKLLLPRWTMGKGYQVQWSPHPVPLPRGSVWTLSYRPTAVLDSPRFGLVSGAGRHDSTDNDYAPPSILADMKHHSLEKANPVVISNTARASWEKLVSCWTNQKWNDF